MFENPDSFLSISFSDRSLCSRCGTCIGGCPVEALSIDPTGYPAIDRDRCVACGRCGRTCPGGAVSYSRLTRLTFGDDWDKDTFDGRCDSMWIGHARDESVRAEAASGGAVTALLLHLLRAGEVNGCVVTRMVSGEAWRGEAFVAKTETELRGASQSRYCVISVNASLQSLRQEAGRFAVVALPCHVHGLRMLLAEDRGLREKVALIIGLYCSSTVEPLGVRDLLRCKGFGHAGAAVDVRFREGSWPGRICAIGINGSRHALHRSNFKDGAINYLFSFYSPQRCLMCIDGSAEFADVSVSDVWQRGTGGGYRHAGESRLLVRTAAGLGALQGAMSSGELEARDVTCDPFFRTHAGHAYTKQVTNRLRVERRRKAGLSAPSYDRKAASRTSADRRLERLKSAIHSVESLPELRYLLLKGLVSPLGGPIIWLRQQLKARRFRT